MRDCRWVKPELTCRSGEPGSEPGASGRLRAGEAGELAGESGIAGGLSSTRSGGSACTSSRVTMSRSASESVSPSP